MFFGSIIPAMLMPGIIGISTEKAITSTPTSVSLRYWAALGVQKSIGAKSSQRPTKVLAHWANQAVRLDSDSAPNAAIARPLSRSLRTSAVARASRLASPRSSVTARTSGLAAAAPIPS
ncbi:hypothetical protein GALL_545890 [mine drainage metagenome]|uniref:Uncharacterized protein n=1 Tax=mine drainage metagenome TaxID=410659 RepID=A0A1J5NYN1_9ZZZZ